MMKRNHTRLCASAAIAAALALSTTPLLAQVAPAPTPVEPAPVLVLPETPPPVVEPVQPTIVLPTDLPDTAPPQTTTVKATTPAPTATTARTARAMAPATPAPTRNRATTPVEPAAAVVEETVEPVAVTPAPEPIAEPAPVAAAEPVVDDSAPGSNNAVLFGLGVIAAIAALVLAIWGFIAIGRRKPVDRKAAAIIERPVVVPPAPQPMAVGPEVIVPQNAPVPIRTAAPAPSVAHSGASVPLPRAIPATFEERDALIQRMVAAKPDRANPFTAPIQRRKRAKLILQSLGRDFGDQEPWIDLSQYPQNWPELARRHAAA